MTKENKKIKNATKCEVNIDGNIIKCRSKLEAYALKKLQENGFTFDYEKTQYIYLDPFTLNPIIKIKSIRAWTYTPYIVVTIPIQMTNNVTMNIKCIIECKGFKNDMAPLKRKFLLDFLNHLNPDEYYYFENTNQKTINQMINVLQAIRNFNFNSTTNANT